MFSANFDNEGHYWLIAKELFETAQSHIKQAETVLEEGDVAKAEAHAAIASAAAQTAQGLTFRSGGFGVVASIE